MRIERHFATIGARQVHYRRAGRGPPVLLLHEAPRSSAGFEPLMRRLAGRYTVIAPDTPGNGLSEPLGIESPTMTDFARAVADLLDVLGIGRCAVYGYHTGAQCALELARTHPVRVARAVINGYLHFDPAFCADILAHYFAPLSIDWSGSHLAWLWSRIREQWSFFPWYRRALAFRPPLDPPSPEALHESVLEMFAAGDAYRDSYRAAFAYEAARTVQLLRVPTLITTPRDDVLFPGLALMPTPAPCVRVVPADDLAHAERLLETELAAIEEELPEPPSPRTAARPHAAWSSYVRVEGVQLHVRRLGEGGARAAVLQHSTVESAACLERLLTALAAHGPAFALDLPGRGASDDLPAGAATGIGSDAELLGAALGELGLRDCGFIGWRGGASVGVELAARAHPSVGRLASLQPWWPLAAPDEAALAAFAPPLPPDTSGTHLLRAWHMLRDQELYQPWHERRRATMVAHHEPDLEPAVVHARLLALFRCGASVADHWRSALRYPALERLGGLAVPHLIGDALPALAERVRAAGNSRAACQSLPQADPAALARALHAFFDRSHK